jgi:hypothetical protein
MAATIVEAVCAENKPFAVGRKQENAAIAIMRAISGVMMQMPPQRLQT